MVTRQLFSVFVLAGAVVTTACYGYGGGSSWTGPTSTSTFPFAGAVRDDSGRLPAGEAALMGAPLSGARVEVMDGPNRGRFAITGENGAFDLGPLPYPVPRVRTTKAGWESREALASDPPIILGQAPHVLWGFVSPPAGDGGVEGVRVEIVDGPNAGKVAFTNAAGLYRFDDLATSASFDLRFSQSKYLTERYSFSDLKANGQVNWRPKAH